MQALQVEGYAGRGIGRYVAGYTAALHRAGAVAAALVAPELPPPAGLPDELVSAGVVHWDSMAALRHVLSDGRGVVHHVTAPFIHPDEPAMVAPVHWARSGAARVTTLYDLIPLRAPAHYLPGTGPADRYRRRAAWVAASDLILAISAHTRAEAIELLGCDPAAVVDVGVGVSDLFGPPDGTDDRLWEARRPGLRPGGFALTVGGSDARKGMGRAIAAVGLAVARGLDIDLLVVGHLTAAWQDELRTAARASGVSGRVHLAGEVSDEELRAAYRRAGVAIMPSLAEGAGLPVLEAAACGCPALASAGTALAETAATPEALFDPGDPDALAVLIERAFTDEPWRRRVGAAQARAAAASTWEAVAERAVTAIDGLGAGTPAPPRPSFGIGGPGVPPAVTEALAAAGTVERMAPGERPASFDAVVWDGPGRAGAGAGWVWLADAADPTAARRMAPTCRGYITSDDRARGRLEMAFPAGKPHPPVVVAGGPGLARHLLG